jgi:hypothetical protein
MPNGSNSPTKATQVKIIDPANNIQVSIDVDAFMPNESVEISGYVAQNHGAYATINESAKIDAKLGRTAHLTVTAKPAPTAPAFQQGDDVMVFVQVAKVWVTVLGARQAQQPVALSQEAAEGSAWDRFVGAAGPDSYSDSQEGNQSAAEYAGQAAPDASSGPRAD